MADRSINHDAVHDVLWITARLQRSLDGVSRAELHLLAYLACILGLYQRRPVSEWGYDFIRSRWGAPFSDDIENAITAATSSGLLRQKGELFVETSAGHEFIEFLRQGQQHAWRQELMEGACSTALALSMGATRDALHAEPSLRRARLHREPRVLLEGSDDVVLYEQFKALSEALAPGVSDLMVPSVVWLAYLAETQLSEMQEISAASGDKNPPAESGPSGE